MDAEEIAAFYAEYRAQVSHCGGRIAAPADLVSTLPDGPEGAAAAGLAVPGPESDVDAASAVRAGQAEARAWLAERGIVTLRIGSCAPVVADGFLPDGSAFTFRARGTSAQLRVFAADQVLIAVRDLEVGADGSLCVGDDGWPVPTQRSVALAEVGVEAVAGSEAAWGAWQEAESWRSEDPVAASGADRPELWPSYQLDCFGDGVEAVWSAHVDGAADFGWTRFEAGAITVMDAARLIELMASVYLAGLRTP